MRLSDFKGKYKGERAFFIGNGPSIRETPLHLMNDEYCFGTNKVYEMFDVVDWRPTHYVAVTNECWRYKDWAKAVQDIVDTGIPCFIAEKYWIFHKLGKTPDWYSPPVGDNIIKIRALTLTHPKTKQKYTGWSDDIEDVVISHRTVSMIFIQLAAWMGFEPLYLLGCDLGYKAHKLGEPDPNHWDGRYHERTTELKAKHNNERMQQTHLEMNEIAYRKGFKIYNATVGGELEAYERVDIHDLLK
jgi:hypothetical protein